MNTEVSNTRNYEPDRHPLILAIQASPRRKGFTDQLMRAILKGIDSQPEVAIEKIFLPDQTLLFCRGCFTCKSAPFHCPLRDDMGENGNGRLHRMLENADGVIITLPTYMWGANALTHNFFERCYPFLWSEQLVGLPFAYATSAYNSGMHRQSAREVEKWGFILGMRQIGGFSVHYSYFNDVKDQLIDLGKRVAKSAIKDALEGKRRQRSKNRFESAGGLSWDLLMMYIDNMTGGTGKKGDLLTTLGFSKGWFKYKEAFRFYKEADCLFRTMIDCMESGKKDEALRLLGKAHRIWKDGTFIEFVSRHPKG